MTRAVSSGRKPRKIFLLSYRRGSRHVALQHPNRGRRPTAFCASARITAPLHLLLCAQAARFGFPLKVRRAV
jgi:hypothetical protein